MEEMWAVVNKEWVRVVEVLSRGNPLSRVRTENGEEVVIYSNSILPEKPPPHILLK